LGGLLNEEIKPNCKCTIALVIHVAEIVLSGGESLSPLLDKIDEYLIKLSAASFLNGGLFAGVAFYSFGSKKWEVLFYALSIILRQVSKIIARSEVIIVSSMIVFVA
jgi:hypothetical protein